MAYYTEQYFLLSTLNIVNCPKVEQIGKKLGQIGWDKFDMGQIDQTSPHTCGYFLSKLYNGGNFLII